MFVFPSNEEWSGLCRKYPFEFPPIPSKFYRSGESFNLLKDGPFEMVRAQEVEAWANNLKGRIADIYISSLLLFFYFDKGIPDDEWWISPGEGGASVQYFPHFQETHFYTNKQFSYFADIIFYQIFSAWDAIAHLLNEALGLGVERDSVTFRGIVQKLHEHYPELHSRLTGIRGDVRYKRASEIRNAFAHKHSPTRVDSGIDVERKENQTVISMSVGKYTTSREIRSTAEGAIELIRKTVEMLEEVEYP